FHTIAPGLFGAVESFVCGLNHLLNFLVGLGGLGHSNADGHRKFVLGVLTAGSGVKTFSRFSGCGAAAIAFLGLALLIIDSTSTCSSFVILLLLSCFISAALLAAAHMKRCCFNCFSEQFHVRNDFRHGSSRKQDRKFLSAHAIRLPAAAYASKPGGNHAEHLVSCVVSVGIVEAFEMVDIYGGDGIRFFQPKQRIVESAPGTQ